ncbi:hypothetical protein FH972_022596 [Carpinus fangiana]|uniref:Uncharacterized protein n=1 Tax=Carpinus fangiana TaxID=176857 RepID=A0A5N6KT13_9ROSI|nr:hypothetical protein FH972_022596 [Carpinus fangiana]
MSGNPFRRQQVPPLDLTAAETRFPPLEDDVAPDGTWCHPTPRTFGPASRPLTPIAEKARRPSQAKRVRIETPPPLSPDPVTPLSPEPATEPIYQVASESHTGSPPPLLAQDGAHEYNPWDRTFDAMAEPQDQEVLENTRRNSASGSATPALPSPEAIRGVPENPFSRTLATMEPGGERPDEEPASKKDGAMGVDDFAKMLLTGKGPPQSSSASSSTATTAGTVPDRARPPETELSSDDYITDSDSDDEEGSNGGGYDATKNVALKGKQKPPPPTHRHGKSVAARKPQTVSFADFGEDPTPPANAVSQQAATRSSGKALPPRPPLGRKTSELNKTLPPPPASGGSVAADTPEAVSAKAAKPPPPPPARRAGNRNSVYDSTSTPVGTPDAASITSANEDYVDNPRRALAGSLHQQQSASPSRSSSQSGRTAMPPPPPPRRRGSSKGSMDLQGRTSQDSTRQPRSSQDSARQVAGEQKEDVLANLEALQAEVDALRDRYRRTS